jgi:LacI family transcriptional regulator
VNPVANITDVAKLAKVSAMTVSRVLNGKGYVKEETKQRVLKAMAELNYVPNDLARSLVRQQTQMIALIVPDITNPFYTTVARGVEDTARKNNYQVILCNSDENVEKERAYIEMCVRIRVDGIVIAPAGDPSKKNLKLLEPFKIPFVLIDRKIEGIQSDVVLGDSIEGAKHLVEHLIELGHRNIAILTGSLNSSTSRDRVEGYKQALEKYNIPFKQNYVKENTYVKSVNEDDIPDLFSLPHPPTAIFAANNFLAAKTFNQLKNMQIRVPEDVSIVCFDEINPMNVTDPFFTAAIQPAYDFGTLGTQLLFERIERIGASARRIILKPEIVFGQSTKPLSTPLDH